jgi:hypothetical protein
MSVKLVKTNTMKCEKCQGANFVAFAQGWVCTNCSLYKYPELKSNDIKKAR